MANLSNIDYLETVDAHRARYLQQMLKRAREKLNKPVTDKEYAQMVLGSY